MGPYGSIWSHTLRIRSHIGYQGSGMAKMGLGFHIISKYSLDVGFKTFSQKKVTYDFERQMQGATLLKCSEFGNTVVSYM